MRLPKVLTISDISSYGKCALGVSLPIISACGVEVIPLPTAVLSSNMKFSGYHMIDLTQELKPMLLHIMSLACPDAVYSGYISTAEFADVLAEFLGAFKGLRIVDPIMGDNGKRYASFTEELCRKVKLLCKNADIITPNLTEACILAGCEYDLQDNSLIGIEKLCKKLSELSPTVIVTGIDFSDKLVTAVYDKVLRVHETERLPYKIGGTGDMFTSILCAKLLIGMDIDSAVDFAQDFIGFTMKQSTAYDDYENRGVCFEPYLSLLANK